MNYGVCINNMFLNFRGFDFRDIHLFLFGFLRMYFGMFGVSCIINCYFEYGTRILCIFCIYEDFLKVCLYIFSKVSQKCEQFSYELFF